MSEKRHIDFIRTVLADKSHGFWYVNPLFITGDWILEKEVNLRRGKGFSSEKDIENPVPDYFFIKDEKNNSYLTIMNKDGLPEDVLIEHGNIFLYKYNSPYISVLKDSEKSFNESHINSMYIVEYNKELYIPLYYKIDDVFEKIYKKKKTKYKSSDYPENLSYLLSYNYEIGDEIDDDGMDFYLLVDKLCMCGFNELSIYIDENFTNYHKAIEYCYSKEDLDWLERKRLYEILKELEEDYYNDIVIKETNVILDEYGDDGFDDYDYDEEYVDMPFWYEITRYSNKNIIINIRSVENKKQREIIKLKVKDEYKNRDDIIENAFNNICLSLVFINQCWFEDDYNDGYDV